MSLFGYVRVLTESVGKLLLDSRYIVLCMAAWFAVSCVVGHATAPGVVADLRSAADFQPEAAPWLEPILRPEIKYRRSEIWDPRLPRLTLGVFVRNAGACAVVVYLGSVVIFIPAFLVFVNGWLCGALLEQGGCQTLLHRVTPHAFVEVPVLLSISSIATLLAVQFYRSVRTDPGPSLLRVLKQASLTYAATLPLLLVSAGLENYGTRLLWG